MSRSTRDPAERAVAVIGVGAILPDALDAKAFWQNVVTGRNSVSEVTPDRWNSATTTTLIPRHRARRIPRSAAGCAACPSSPPSIASLPR